MSIQKSDELKYVALTLTDELWFTTYESMMEHFGVSMTCIRNTLNGHKTKLVRQGVMIYTLAEYDELSPTREHKVCKGARKVCGVHMLDRYTNEIIETFASIKEACDDLGIGSHATSISACARGRIPTAYGYKWEYVEASENVGRYVLIMNEEEHYLNTLEEVAEVANIHKLVAHKILHNQYKKTRKYDHLKIFLSKDYVA